MRLPDFIRNNAAAIVADWQEFAESLAPAGVMSQLQLKDHIEQILIFIADDIESSQTKRQQLAKSRGMADRESPADTAAETHASLRHDDGFDIVEMVSEYRALRTSIVKLWTRASSSLTEDDLIDLTRFNEAIDQALAESVVRFTQQVDVSKNLLLGVLGHDIRSPLATVHMSAELLARSGPMDGRQTQLIEQIKASTVRVRDIVTDLLDLAKAQIGGGLPLTRAPMSLTSLAENIVAEVGVQNPNRPIELTYTGDIEGNWDDLRLGQVLSNLLANAMQYGTPGTQVVVNLVSEKHDIEMTVHNEGPPIPQAHMKSIFNSFTRAPNDNEPSAGITGQNLGLGLFVTKEIVQGHGGEIKVTSSQSEGTTFIIRLPKGIGGA